MESHVSTAQFSKDDRVVHALRLEWGVGRVLRAETTQHDGTPCQRLTIRFERAGLKTLSTGVAQIESAQSVLERAAALAATDASPASINDKTLRQTMGALPERAVDPFGSLESRLGATLDLYRFSAAPGPLVDWAAAQTGLTDPLSRFNRHELELFFEKFRLNRDEHLKRLVTELARKDPDGLRRALEQAPSDAQLVLRNGNIRR